MLLVTALVGTPLAQAQDLKSCTALADNTARLACYDALATQSAPATDPAASFGKPAQKTDGAEHLEAHLVGSFKGWKLNDHFTLDNGQVWKCVDEEGGYYSNVPDNPEVVLGRGFFGGYWLEIKAIGRKIGVQRIK